MTIENKVKIVDSVLGGSDKLLVQGATIKDCQIESWIVSIKSNCQGERVEYIRGYNPESEPTPSYIK